MEIQPKCLTGILDSIESRPDPCPETFAFVARLTVATTPGFDGRFFVIEEDNPWFLNGALRVRGHLDFYQSHFEKEAMPRSIRPDDKSDNNWSRTR
jgi:hypothetical protein